MKMVRVPSCLCCTEVMLKMGGHFQKAPTLADCFAEKALLETWKIQSKLASKEIEFQTDEICTTGPRSPSRTPLN
jgi:hypothetical protein